MDSVAGWNRPVARPDEPQRNRPIATHRPAVTNSSVVVPSGRQPAGRKRSCDRDRIGRRTLDAGTWSAFGDLSRGVKQQIGHTPCPATVGSGPAVAVVAEGFRKRDGGVPFRPASNMPATFRITVPLAACCTSGPRTSAPGFSRSSGPLGRRRLLVSISGPREMSARQAPAEIELSRSVNRVRSFRNSSSFSFSAQPATTRFPVSTSTRRS